jgi:hypothetical protein
MILILFCDVSAGLGCWPQDVILGRLGQLWGATNATVPAAVEAKAWLDTNDHLFQSRRCK